jgi:type VI secretion system protein ImpG
VDASSAPYRPELRQLGIKALCTNRHLPINMAVRLEGRADFTMDISAPVTSIRCLSGPTAPTPSQAEGRFSWRLISHLSLNYLSLIDAKTEGAVGLREILKLYTDPRDRQTARQIEGLLSVQSKPILRRVKTPGPITFARGLEVTLTFDESAFEGIGVFILGAVLEQFLAKYVSLNSFTETVIKTQQRGEIMRWPAQVGTRQIL